MQITLLSLFTQLIVHCRKFHCLQFASSVCLYLDGILKGEAWGERERERERERDVIQGLRCKENLKTILD